METGVLQLQVRSSETAFQLIWDKLTLAFNDLKRLLKAFLFGCWDRGTLQLTLKAVPHKFSFVLTYLLTLTLIRAILDYAARYKFHICMYVCKTFLFATDYQ